MRHYHIENKNNTEKEIILVSNTELPTSGTIPAHKLNLIDGYFEKTVECEYNWQYDEQTVTSHWDYVNLTDHTNMRRGMVLSKLAMDRRPKKEITKEEAEAMWFLESL